ncbi:hypothetical protein ACFV00_15335 [Streptomyces californicus]|uniref:hypothetical protein n=1 Tax=Streptomyces californicus TaxID=67351 RepID=UPI0036C0EBFA
MADIYQAGTAAAADNVGLSPAPPVPAIASLSAVADGQRLISRLTAPASGRGLAVARITVQYTGPDRPRAYVYVGTPTGPNLVSGTRSGTFDESEYTRSLYVPAGQDLCVVWLSTQGEALARIEYQEA